MVAKADKGKVQQQLLPALFSCAARVTMPQLGGEDPEMRRHLRKPEQTHLSLKPPPIDDTPLDKRYLRQISSGLVFDEAVVKERCFHMMPYDSKYLSEALDISDIIPEHPRLALIGRRNDRGRVVQHMPCGLRLTKPSTLKPLKRKIIQHALAMSTASSAQAKDGKDTEAAPESTQSVTSSQSKSIQVKAEKVSETFMTEVAEEVDKPKKSETLQQLDEKLTELKAAAEAEEEAKQPPVGRRLKGPKKDWDAYLISQLSPLTATWIVHERMSPNHQRQDLMKTLHGWYGKPKHTDLVQEEGSQSEDEDFDPLKKDKKEKPKQKWKKKKASLLERVYSGHPGQKPVAHDPYSDDNEAPFYRQPAGIRRQKKHFEKEEADKADPKKKEDTKQEEMIKSSINATAHQIKVKSIKEPKPPTLRDFMNPAVGSTILDTSNQYQQEMLTGVRHVYQKAGDGSTIVMESDHKYKKVLRPDYPTDPQQWYPPTDAEKKQRAGSAKKVKYGFRTPKWKALPEPYDDTFEAQKVVPPGFDAEAVRVVDPAAKKQIKQNHSLMQILHDWRAKWNLSGQFADASYDDIIQDMADIQPHVRLKAIATVGRAAEYRPPSEAGIKLGAEQALEDDPLLGIPDRVFVALECLLDDLDKQVKKAAAVTLYALEHPCKKAEEILLTALKSEVSSERWMAAQCLAHYGICDSHVVDEIIKQILASEEPIKHEKGAVLLATISSSTMLVHSMLGEQLNSSSWRHRVIACKILPALYGTINKDLTQKLTHLMWHDWHEEVRRAAAQCLGKTSHGRDVHDDIRRAIMYGSERVRLEAISRLGQLGIMTAKLLPAFLKCFDDQYVSIRSECCITCSNLCIQEEQVVKKLVHLGTFDPIWKVKALAIQALGRTGVVNKAVKECLIWAMRYEEKATVRVEACHSLVRLNILDEDVVGSIQERLLVESSQVVRDEMIEALQSIGVNALEDVDTVAQIKMEVRKLCNRNVIASQIALNEVDDLRQENLLNMIYTSEEETNQAQTRLKESAAEQLRRLASASEKSIYGVTHAIKEESEMSVMSTPDAVSREGTLFTPSAEKELEAILNRVEVASEPSGESESKSRPVTGRTETSGMYISTEMSSPTSKFSMPEYIQEVDRQLWSAAQMEPPLPALTPLSRSRLGLSPTASVADLKGSGSQMSLQLSGSRTVISRETIHEREKLDQQVSDTYRGLTARYVDMINELVKIDYGLSVAPPSSELSKFLRVPGDIAPKPPEAPTPNQRGTGTSKTSSNKTASAVESLTDDAEEEEQEQVERLEEDEVMEKEDGQVAVSFEVPVSESQAEKSATAPVYTSDEDKSHDVAQSGGYSTYYPSLGDDAAPSYIDENKVAASTNGESTTYQAGQASEYEQSGPSDIDNKSTLD